MPTLALDIASSAYLFLVSIIHNLILLYCKLHISGQVTSIASLLILVSSQTSLTYVLANYH